MYYDIYLNQNENITKIIIFFAEEENCDAGTDMNDSFENNSTGIEMSDDDFVPFVPPRSKAKKEQFKSK